MKNWQKYFPGKVKYGWDDGWYFFDSRTFNVLFSIKERRVPEELLEAIQTTCNGNYFEELEGPLKVQNSYKRNKKVYIHYLGKTYTLDFELSYFLQFECPTRFDKKEADECEEDFVNVFASDLQILVADIL